MSSRSAFCRAIRCSTSSSGAAPLSLTSQSPYIRPLAGPSSRSHDHTAASSRDFLFWPRFFDDHESREMLGMALWKLDRADTTRRRRRKRTSSEEPASGSISEAQLQDMFEGDYGFEEGHYDSVIHHYRETLLSSLPPSPAPSLTALLSRLYALLPQHDRETNTDTRIDSLPPAKTTTHLLHLSPRGAILPHVDNLEASGSVILGLSLGAERTMRLKRKDGEDGWELRLPSGSVYLQRDAIRYQYEHSILPYGDPGSTWDAQPLDAGHRVSIMIRDAPSRAAGL